MERNKLKPRSNLVKCPCLNEDYRSFKKRRKWAWHVNIMKSPLYSNLPVCPLRFSSTPLLLDSPCLCARESSPFLAPGGQSALRRRRWLGGTSSSAEPGKSGRPPSHPSRSFPSPLREPTAPVNPNNRQRRRPRRRPVSPPRRLASAWPRSPSVAAAAVALAIRLLLVSTKTETHLLLQSEKG
jgi:hypothetical protein